MAKVLVLYYSMYGHIETMAQAVAEGARSVSGAEVTIKRVPETMPEEAFKNAGGKANQTAEVASPAELADYDAILFGVPTRFGNMPGQMRTFFDQTGGLWVKGALINKLGSVFTSTGTGGGQEMTATTTWATLAHHGWAWTTGGNIELTGTIVAARLGNPHGILQVDAGGEVWQVEVGQPWRNAQAGLKDGDLVAGVEVTVIGEPSADPADRRLKAERLVIGGRDYILYPDRS